MESVKGIFKMRGEGASFAPPSRQNIEQTENYAFKQVVHTKELYVDGTPVTPATTHAPTNYTGADFAGANPAKTLTHSRTLPDNVMLTIGGRVMHRTLEYTIAGAVITMVDVEIDDADNIMVVD